MADDENSPDDAGEGKEQGEGDRPARQRGDRLRADDDASDQLEEIEEAQRRIRQGKAKGIIDSIEKSRQRAKQQLDDIRSLDDLKEE